MKSVKLLFLSLIICLPVLISAQIDDSAPKNEFGTDITLLIEQIFNFNEAPYYSNYFPLYHFTFKRYFNQFSIRAGIGGRTWDERDENNYSRMINYRLGVERSIDFNKRWSSYFGVDFIHQLNNSRTENHYINGGWQHGQENQNSKIGVSPIIGIEFKINSRISLQTETKFYAYFVNQSQKPIITQIDENPILDKPSTEIIEHKSWMMEFFVPNFLVLAIKI